MQRINTTVHQPAALRFTATAVSYLFHPLFIPTYFFLFVVYQFPYEFTGITEWRLKMLVFNVFWMTAFFPAFSVFLLWRLKLSENIYLRTQKERIIPFFITMFFYWWMYYLSRNAFTDQPAALKFFYFGIFISTSAGVIINNFIKISLHGMAMGGALAALTLFAFYYHTPLTVAISISTLLTGLVCTCRLLASDHSTVEIYAGVTLGVLCQVVAYQVIM